MTDELLPAEIAAAQQMGWHMAIEQAISGLIATHPAKAVLLAWLETNRETTLALMLQHAKHDELIASFENTSKRLLGP